MERNHEEKDSVDVQKKVGIRILPIDPLSRVTGSCTLVHEPTRDIRLLIDCGAYQGEHDAEKRNREPFPFDPKGIHCVLLTHAHYDHCGRLPDLIQAGFEGNVYATKETIELAQIVLYDSAKIRRDKKAKAAINKLKWVELRHLDRKRPVAEDLFVTILRSSHIVGAVSFVLSHLYDEKNKKWNNLVFSGDVGNNTDESTVQPFLRKRMNPSHVGDVAVLESTYGNREREPSDLDPTCRRSALKRKILRGLENRGTVMLPVFSVQRMQDVLYDLHVLMAWDPDFLRGIPVLVDGPMAGRVNKVLRDSLDRDDVSRTKKVRPFWLSKGACRDLGLDPNNADHIEIVRELWKEVLLRPKDYRIKRDQDPAYDCAVDLSVPGLSNCVRQFRVQRFVVHNSEPERDAVVGLEGPRVVLATSGMCMGGPIVRWLSEHVTRANSTVIFTGYCAPNTLAHELLELSRLPQAERARYRAPLMVGDREVSRGNILLNIDRISGYSGHADQRGLVDWVFPKYSDGTVRTVAKRVFLTHGTDRAREALRDKIKERALEYGLPIEVEVLKPRCGAFDVRLGEFVSREDVLGKGAQEDLASVCAGLTYEEWSALPERLRKVLWDLA